jgi:hypothetical protein
VGLPLCEGVGKVEAEPMPLGAPVPVAEGVGETSLEGVPLGVLLGVLVPE